MVISETKLDYPFLRVNSKFLGFPHHSVQIKIGILEVPWYLSVRTLQPNFLSFEDKPIEALFIELNFWKKKWLLSHSYNPNKINISNHLQRLRNSLDLYYAKYENIISIGDFRVSPEYSHVETVCECYGLKSLIKVPPTCQYFPYLSKSQIFFLHRLNFNEQSFEVSKFRCNRDWIVRFS